MVTRIVRLMSTMAGPSGHVPAGAVAELDSVTARTLVERGMAAFCTGTPTVRIVSAALAPAVGRYDPINHEPYRLACERRDEFGQLLMATRQRRGQAEVLLAAAAEARQTSLAREADLLLDGDGGGMHAARAKAAAAMKEAEQAEQAATEAEHEEAVILAALGKLDSEIERLRADARLAMAAQARADHQLAMTEFIEAAVRLSVAHSELLQIQDTAIASLGDSGGGQIRAIRWAGLGTAADPNSILSAWIKDLRQANYDLNLQGVTNDAN